MKTVLWILLLSLPMPQVLATTAEEKGLEIAKEAERRDQGFGDLSAEMTMLLKNRHGEESLRNMRNRTLEGTEDGDKTLLTFDRPRDVKGTTLLTFTHKVGSDDQWLYLPALRRVKRIASRNKSGPFMGSEFAYEDLTSQEIEKYTYKYLRDETLMGKDCFLIQRIPLDPNSGYTRQEVWVDKAEYQIQKVNYYDRKSALLKTLVFRGYQQYLNQYWRADEMYMENHQTGKSTLLSWKDYKFKNGFGDRDFDRSSLKRAR